MRTKRIFYLSIIAITLGLIGFTACKRDKFPDDSITEDTGYMEDYSKIEQSFEEVSAMGDEADALDHVALKGGNFQLSGCAAVKKDTISIPHTITIDFGATNCMCTDGRNRRGQVIISYQGRYRDSGFVHGITFNNYYVNDNHVYGSKKVTNMGRNSSGKIYFNIAIDGHLVINSTNDTISHVGNRVRTWVAGEATHQVSDDEYSITGGGTVTKANGKTFTVNIVNALHVAANCNWIESGTVHIAPQGLPARLLDYGAGTCDHFATITVGTHSKTIILH